MKIIIYCFKNVSLGKLFPIISKDIFDSLPSMHKTDYNFNYNYIFLVNYITETLICLSMSTFIINTD